MASQKRAEQVRVLCAFSMVQAASQFGFARHFEAVSCRIPDDCIDSKRYPLFIARAVLRELIESLEPTGSVKP